MSDEAFGYLIQKIIKTGWKKISLWNSKLFAENEFFLQRIWMISCGIDPTTKLHHEEIRYYAAKKTVIIGP